MSRPRRFDPPWVHFFDLPCPWFKSQLLSFPQFLMLPGELRGLIWNFAVAHEDANYISIETMTEYFPKANSYEVIDYKLPSGLLHACRDARYAATKRWNLAFGDYFVPFYFDFQEDWLVLDSASFERISISSRGQENASEDAGKVQQVCLWTRDMLTIRQTIIYLATFPRLNRLQIIQPDRGPTHLRPVSQAAIPDYNLYKLDFPVYGFHQAVSSAFGRRVRQEMKIRGTSPAMWNAPMLMFGTKMQWSRMRSDPHMQPEKEESTPSDQVEARLSTCSIHTVEESEPPFDSSTLGLPSNKAEGLHHMILRLKCEGSYKRHELRWYY